MDTFLPGLIGRLRETPWRRVRFLEAVAATAEPAVQRGGVGTGTTVPGSDGDADADDGNSNTDTCPTCEGGGVKNNALCPTCNGSGSKGPAQVREAVALKPLTVAGVERLREATATGAPVYEVELLAEGPSKTSGVYYTAAALREAVANKVFEGMHAYAMHPRKGTPENAEPGNRDLRQLVGYYRNVKFVESGSLGKQAVSAELVLNKGQGWFTNLMESAIAARKDGVQLCGISIDAEGFVEPGEVGGQRYNLCRSITAAPSADVVSEAAAGGTIVRKLRESVARTQLPKPQEAHMKLAEFTPKLEAAHTRLRESVTALTKDGATDEDVKGALAGIATAEGEIKSLRESTIDPETVEVEKIVEKVVPGDGDNAELEAKLATTETSLREAVTAKETAESERDEKDKELVASNRSLLAAKVLREAKIATDTPIAGRLFNELVQLDGEPAMKTHLDGVKAYEEDMFSRFRESLGIGTPSAVEGAGALIPVGAPIGSGGADRLAEAGIPLTPEPSN